jgi:taurine--2-oxoglutarate transaminase
VPGGAVAHTLLASFNDASSVERLIAANPGEIAGLIVEPVAGNMGTVLPDPGFLQTLRALCDAHGIVLILDEVMAGFGRTGQWFAFDAFDVRPDLITFAKGVNSGYVPVGGVIISDEIAHAFDDRVFPGGLTYSGHPLAAASIVAALTAMEEEGVVANAALIGSDVLGPGLADLAARHELVGEVRGSGVFWAIELVSDRGTREPVAAATMAELKRDLVARGLLPFVVENRIHVVPPAVVTAAEAHHGLQLIDEALSALGD